MRAWSADVVFVLASNEDTLLLFDGEDFVPASDAFGELSTLPGPVGSLSGDPTVGLWLSTYDEQAQRLERWHFDGAVWIELALPEALHPAGMFPGGVFHPTVDGAWLDDGKQLWRGEACPP